MLLISRAALAAIFLRSGVRALINPGWQVDQAKRALPQLPEPELVARVQAAVQVTGGLMLVAGVATRLAAASLAATLIPVTYVGHPFWKHEDQQQRNQQLTHFLKNAGIFGGLMLVAAGASGKSDS